MNDPYALPDIGVVLLVVVIGSGGVLLLLGLTVVALARATRRRWWAFPAALATAAAAAGLGGYVWGTLHLMMDETQADELCKSSVPAGQAGHVAGYETSFIPLRFGCLLPDGRAVATAVPEDVNGFVLGMTAVAFAGALTAGSMRPRTSGPDVLPDVSRTGNRS